MIAPSRWSPAAGLRLEPNALRSVIELEHNLLVIAGPGAGKTEMLAQRADFLLKTGACPYPRRILAISFKTDASTNLRDRVAERCGPELASRFDSHTFHAFAKRIIDRFRVVLTGTDALNADYTVGEQRVLGRQITFNDMVPLGTTILADAPVARNAVRNTYSHVFLDEFQDCTNVQYALLRAAFHATPAVLTAVGDSKQRIMGWAGALDGIFDQFATDFATEVVHLYQNYRSARRIRRVHNAMVKVMEPSAAVPDFDLEGDGGEVQIAHYRDCTEEAQALAEQIDTWITVEGIAPSEIAVLVRQQTDLFAQRLMAELDDRDISYRNEQAVQDDFAEPLGQLILDFLALTVHDRQPEAYRRLMSIVTVTSGDDEVDQQNAASWHRYLHEVRLAIRRERRIEGDRETLTSAVTAFLEAVGRTRLAALSPEYATGDRFDRLAASILGRLGDLADHRALEDIAQVTDDGYVRILTIHKSKGLEFHTVVVLGIEDETFWSRDEDANRAEFFVAVSRAKRRLVLTTADHRERPPGARYWTERRAAHGEFLQYADA